MIYSLAPQYVMYGSQKYLVQVRNYVWMCSQICISAAELQLRWSLLMVDGGVASLISVKVSTVVS